MHEKSVQLLLNILFKISTNNNIEHGGQEVDSDQEVWSVHWPQVHCSVMQIIYPNSYLLCLRQLRHQLCAALKESWDNCQAQFLLASIARPSWVSTIIALHQTPTRPNPTRPNRESIQTPLAILSGWQATLLLTHLKICETKKYSEPPPPKTTTTYLTNLTQINLTCPELGTAQPQLVSIYC